MAPIRAFLAGDKFAELCGITLLEVQRGYARSRMVLSDKHLNGYRVTQGGAIFTLADYAFAAASNAYGKVAVGINVSISFVKASRSGTLTAQARETSRNPKIATYDIQVTDDAGEVVALFHGMVYRKSEVVPGVKGVRESDGEIERVAVTTRDD